MHTPNKNPEQIQSIRRRPQREQKERRRAPGGDGSGPRRSGARRDGRRPALLRRLRRAHQVRARRRREPGRLLRLPRPRRARRSCPRRFPPREKSETSVDTAARHLLCSSWLHWALCLSAPIPPRPRLH